MNVSNEKAYIAFTITREGQDFVYAVPIENVDAVISADGKAPYAVLPGTPEYVLCVMNPYGGRFVSIINLLNLFGFSFRPKTADVIVLIIFSGQMIGVPAKNAYLISAYPDELSDDAITGTKVFTHNKTQYFVLDVPRLYNYLNLSA